jgi:hypothetical protein
MYVPPYDALLRSLHTTPAAVDAAEGVTIPGSLLKMLLQLAVASCDFDEQAYLEANPDVRGAVERGAIESGHVHYIGFGYFEGRRGGGALVDESWYLSKYPDVAAAIRDSRIKSATQHFHAIGAGEGRSPNAELEVDAAQWKGCLQPGETTMRVAV